MKRIIFLSLSVLCFAACGKMKPNTSEPSSVTISTDANVGAGALAVSNEKEAYSPEEPSPAVPHRLETKIPTQIIKNADLRMQVEKLDVSYTKIQGMVRQFGSYFGNDNRSQSDYEITQDMIIRVPSVQFDSLLNALASEGIYINYKNVSAEDVTDQFVDIEARMKTKKEVELRYLTLLKEAKKVSDILEVENNLRTIREEIEVQEGRLKLLKDQVSYSTIHLSMYQTLEFKAKPSSSFVSQIAESFSNGWSGLKGFTLGLISLWPFLIIIGITALAVKKWRNRKK